MSSGLRKYFICYIFALHLISAIATNQHLVCKTVGDIFSETSQYPAHQRADRRSQGIQGRPGKRGPIGPGGMAGPPGMKGEPGYVDYINISEIINATVKEGLAEIYGRLEALQKNVTDLSRYREEWICGIQNLQYNGSCYMVANFSESGGLNRQSAIQTCHNIGFNILELNHRTEQEIVENFVRSTVTFSNSEVYFWLGMTFDPTTRMLRYRSSKQVEVNHLLWYPGYPITGRANVYIMLGVKNSGSDGIWNYKDYPAHGVICEKKLPAEALA